MGKQEGFSLLEVLISTLVLAIGLLGIAGLQLNAVRFNSSAQLRAIAVSQAGNIIDRMMANPAGVDSSAYNNVSGTPSDPSCSVCTPAQIAQHDIHQWNTNNATLLPLGQGTVTRNGDLFVVTVRWDNERTGATGTACSGNEQVDLTCLTMEVQL